MIFQNLTTKQPPLVLVAGGKSERMGVPKGLLSFNGKPWLLYQLDAYRRAGGKYVVVVLGYHAETYLKELPCLTTGERGSLKIDTLINRQPEYGPFSTIQTGLDFLLKETNENKFAFLALDKPAPSEKVWASLIKSECDMAYPVRNGLDGHPVIVTRALAKQICQADPSTTKMNELRKSVSCQSIEQSDPLVGWNLNTPDEWREFCEKERGLGLITEQLIGDVNSGKTTRLQNEIKVMQAAGIKVGGIFQPHEESVYYAQDILTDERRVLATQTPDYQPNGMTYIFHEETWSWAAERIIYARKTCDILAVDEIGRLEARRMGHWDALTAPVADESIIGRLLSIRADIRDTLPF